MLGIDIFSLEMAFSFKCVIIKLNKKVKNIQNLRIFLEDYGGSNV